MKKIYLSLFLFLLIDAAKSQAPYIGTAGGDGLGQYGYLEKDAVTFARLFRNTYNNIAYLSARWFVTDNSSGNGNGKEYLYHVYAGPDWNSSVGWQCGGDNDSSKRTTDYTIADFSPEWTAGADAYVSVCAKYCDDTYFPTSYNGTTTFGAVGFNERHFQVLDVDTSLHVSTASNIPDGNGICETSNAYHVAGSFAITPGSLTGIALTRLFIINNGSALEGTDIPNGAFNVYYEPVTGSEVYGDGNETFAGTLYGDWGGGSLTDNIFGSEALNIPLNGKVRVYVLLCDFNAAGLNKSVNLAIINDGISLSPALDTYNKLRINLSGISQRLITLPVRINALTGKFQNGQVQLNWNLSGSSQGDRSLVQTSADGDRFATVGTVPVNLAALQNGQYQSQITTTNTYFRIQVQSASGAIVSTSNVVRLTPAGNSQLLIQNPVSDHINIQYVGTGTASYQLRLLDASGRLLLQQMLLLKPGNNAIALPGKLATQSLVLLLTNTRGEVSSYQLLKQ